MFQLLTLALGLLSVPVSSLSVQRAEPSCRNVVIPVSAKAINKIIPLDLDLSSIAPVTDLLALVNSFLDGEVSGQYNIAARYCEPANAVASRANTLQILVHGISFDRSYWVGQSSGDSQYSYVAAASAAGYPTLAIDRICNGGSSQLSGTLACQIPLDAAVQHQVITAVRNGAVANKKFAKIIYVTHSYGSLTANALMRSYPNDVDALVLTGFTPFLLGGAAGFLVSGSFTPATLVNPLKYTLTPLDYLIATNRAGIKGVFFRTGGFDPKIEDLLWRERGTIPLGEFLTAPLGQLPAVGYKGPLFVANGQNDQLFCSRGQLDPLVGDLGDCGQGASSASNQVRVLFPSANSLDTIQTSLASHALNLHLSGSDATTAIISWLAGKGF